MPLPPNVDLITVTGTFCFVDATFPDNSTVEFRPSGDPWLKDATAPAILLPKTVVCTINATGQLVGPPTAVGTGGVGVKLPAVNDPDIAPNGWVYNVTIKISGLPETTYAVSLTTDKPTVDLAELAPVTPVEGGLLVVTTVNGKTPGPSGAITLIASDVGALPVDYPVVQSVNGKTGSSITISAADLGVTIPPDGTDLAAWLASYTTPMSTTQPYREPTTQEAADAVLGIERLALAGADAAALLGPLGYTVTTGVDSVSKRSYALAYNEAGTDRAWGAVLVDLSQPIRLVIQSPHPVADQNSELLALTHWQQTPGALLVIAGAHRNAANDAQQGGYSLADVCKQTGSLFHQVCAAYASRNVPAVQWHGYADASAPGLEKIVATGSGNAGPTARRIAEELADAGFAVGRGWDSSGSDTGLIGLTNVQGDDALAKGVVWTHVENSATTRNDPVSRARTVAAVVAAQPEVAGVAKLLAQSTSGQFPSRVGSANTVGTSPYPARADHIHASRQADLDRITALEAGKVVALTASATITTDAAAGSHFRVTLAGNRTLANPTNATDGKRITWELIQDATGSRTLTLGSAFALGSDLTAVTLSTAAGKHDFLTAVYNATEDKWYVLDLRRGY